MQLRANSFLIIMGLYLHNGTINFSVSDPYKNEKNKSKLGHINAITSIGNTTKRQC